MYRWVTESLKGRIESGEYSPGTQLPSMVELRAEFRVSDITVRTALKDLAQRGYIETRPRRGIFVCATRTRMRLSAPKDGRVVAAVITDSGSAFCSAIVRAVENECRARGYHLVIANSRGDIEVEKRLLLELAPQVSGLLVMPNLHGEYSSYEKLLAQEVALVFVDQHIPQLPISSVTTDNTLGGYLATKHLIEQGRREIFFIGQPNAISVEERLDGYKQALAEAAIPFDENHLFYVEDFTEAGGYIASRRLLASTRKGAPLGVFAVNDYFARSCCIAATEAGLRVPQDVAVVGYDDVIAVFSNPPLSSVRQDLQEMGQSAARILLDALQESDGFAAPKIARLRLRPQLIVRDSSDENSGFSLARHIENVAAEAA